MDIEIKKDCRAINILFSGGVDSSLLFYLLAEKVHNEKLNIPILCYVFGNNYRIKSVHNVFQYVNEKFPIFSKIVVKPRNYLIRKITEKILISEGHYVYSGCNKVVENEFTPTKYIPNDTPPYRGPAYNEFHIRPFINIDKKEIVKIYIEKNILDMLDITHSCGLEFEYPCNECYFCMEKNWALESLNLISGERHD